MKARKKIAVLVVLCMVMPLLVGMFSFGCISVSAAYPDPNGKYITPTGAGLKNGSSWEDAYGFNTTSFATAWGAVPSNGTLYVGSGTYSNPSITASSSGQSSTSPKKLLGFDTGSGKPVVHGAYTPTNGNTGTFFTVNSGVSNITVENIRVENYCYGVKTSGNQSYIVVRNLDAYVINGGLYLNGGGTTGNAYKLCNVTVENCNFYYYKKGAIRTLNRVEDVLVSNCFADAGGEAYWYSDNWPVGFQLTCETSDVAERRISFVDCIAVNSYQEDGTGYWNGDGFTTERGAYDISYTRCKAFGSTDAGWDCKGENITLTDCISMDNKENYKFWGTTQLTNCVGAYAHTRGGSTNPIGLWTNGTLQADFSTIINNDSVQVSNDGTMTLNDCIIQAGISGEALYGGTINVTRHRTAEYLLGGCGTDPLINVTEGSYFYGDSGKYNSGLYGNTKGYYFNSTNETVLLSDNFDGYADTTAVAAAGWSLGGTPTNVPILVTTAVPAYAQYLQTKGGSTASKTFAPVSVKDYTGAVNPGKNAKIVIEFDGYAYSGQSAQAQSYFRLDQTGTSNSAFSVGRRAATAMSGKMYYSKNIASPSTNLLVTDSLARFTKIKAEIKITDSAGAFLTGGPKVSIWCNGALVLANLAAIDTAANYVDGFTFGGGDYKLNTELDNLSIKLVTDSSFVATQKTVTAAVVSGTGTISPTGSFAIDKNDGQTFIITPGTGMALDYVRVNGITQPASKLINYMTGKYQYTLGGVTANTTVDTKFYDPATETISPSETPTPVPTPVTLIEDNFNGYADTTAVAAAGWTLGGTPTNVPILLTTAAPAYAQYLQTKGGSSASKTFAPVALRDYVGAVHPGKNAKLVIEFDGYAYSGQSASAQSYFKLYQSGSSNCAFSVGRRAGTPSRVDYSNNILSPSTSLMVTNSIARFTKIKAEIKITDVDGAFLNGGPKVSIWCNNELILANLGLISSGTQFIDSFSFGGGDYRLNTELDNLSIKLYTDDVTIPVQKTVTATVDAGAAGTISPGGSFALDENGGQTFIIIPTTGATIEYLKVNGVAVDVSDIINYATGKYQYTLPGVTADTTVNVKFV